MRLICGFTIALYSCVLLAASEPEPPARSSEAAADLFTLESAVERALAASPRLVSAKADIRSAQGEAEQAGYRPNPELGFEAENVGGNGRYRGVDSAVYTLGFSQKFETGGKRALRSEAAEQKISLRNIQLADEHLELVEQVTIAYSRLVATQEQLSLARERSELARELLNEVEERVQAAREPAIQRHKAQIALARAQLTEETLDRELKHSQQVLASFWLGHDESLRYDDAHFFALVEPVSEEELVEGLRRHPEFLYRKAEQKRQRALMKLEKAQALPDPSVQLGVRRFEETGDQAVVLGLSVPLPVFNRNRGNIVRSRAGLDKAASDRDNTWIALSNEALQALEDMLNAYRQALTLSATIIPSAESAFQLAREGYRSGRFPYLEVLDAQRTLFETRESHIEALKQYHVAKAKVDYAMAIHQGENSNEHN